MKNKEKKKIKSEKARRFPKFYVIDAMIILLVIAVCIGIYFRFNAFGTFASLRNQADFEVSFTIKNVEENTIDRVVRVGNNVYFKNSGETFGSIISNNDDSTGVFSSTPAKKIFYEGSEKIVVAYPNTYFDLQGKIKCKGNITDGFYMINGTRPIARGETYTVCTEKATFEIIINEIKTSK